MFWLLIYNILYIPGWSGTGSFSLSWEGLFIGYCTLSPFDILSCCMPSCCNSRHNLCVTVGWRNALPQKIKITNHMEMYSQIFFCNCCAKLSPFDILVLQFHPLICVALNYFDSDYLNKCWRMDLTSQNRLQTYA